MLHYFMTCYYNKLLLNTKDLRLHINLRVLILQVLILIDQKY